MYDVVIVGAGPAGATLARVIGHKYRVLLVDKRFGTLAESPREKCCGGLLAPDAQKILGRMGVALPRDVLVGPQIFVVRSIDLESGLEKYYQRFYININRGKFDRWLVSLVPAAVETWFGWRLGAIEPADGKYRVHLYSQGRTETVEGKVIVGADGASSLVRRRLYPAQQAPRRYLALQEWFYTEESLPYFSAIFDSSITDFYAWTIPKERYLILGAALSPGKDAAAKFSLLKEKLVDYGYSLGKGLKSESAVVLRPVGIRKIFTGKGQAMLIGEAAGLISPSSAEGLSYAFTSALFAAKALDEGLSAPAERYRKLVKSLHGNICLKNIKGSLMYFPLTRRLIMASGLFSMDVGEQ